MIDSARLNDIKDFDSFIGFLSGSYPNGLEWRIDDNIEDIDEISYQWTEEELQAEGLSRKVVDGRIYQLRPLIQNQPWGIFILEFKEPDVFTSGRGITGILRRILNVLIPNRRKGAEVPSWNMENLLFICTYKFRYFGFSHFQAPENKNGQSVLKTFWWGQNLPSRTACEFNLPHLRWPDTEDDKDAWLAEWSRAFDVEAVTKRFYDDYSDLFAKIENEIKGLNSKEEKRLFTQLLLNRLMFLRFIERKGWLEFENNKDYLKSIYEAGGNQKESLFLTRIRPLFFQALARPGFQESKVTGKVKYLNGGLFEEQALDKKVNDIPDKVFKWIIGPTGLFYRYNFTVQESTPSDIEVAVDPEMLGKVFEKLVTNRKEKGSYYTPRPIVSFMCRETLKGYLGGYERLVDDKNSDDLTMSEARGLLEKLHKVKIVDPACGSGAYLLGMLYELHSILKALDIRAGELTARDDYERRLSIIQNNLYGVDIEEFAANIACLRLWLSLAVEYEGDDPPPLPNLDFKIGIGDSLTAPSPISIEIDLFRQHQIKQFAELKAEYTADHDPSRKSELKRNITELRDDLVKWHRSNKIVEGFDWDIEFAEVFFPPETKGMNGGFDIAIANPPYGAKVPDKLRKRYFDPASEGTQSKEIYGIFMARALQLLKSGGNFSFIVSDTWRTIGSHRPLRQKLLSNTTILHFIELPGWIFDATVNTCILTLSNIKATENHKLISGDLKGIPKDNWDLLSKNMRAISYSGPDIQTVDYARYTYLQYLVYKYSNYAFFIGMPELYELMSDNRFITLADVAEIKHGMTTGDNPKYIFAKPSARGNYKVASDDAILSKSEMSNLTQKEWYYGFDKSKFGGKFLIPHDKGGSSKADIGWLPNYYVPTDYYIAWDKQTVSEMMSLPGHRHDNPQYYGKRGLTFSTTGVYAPTFRLNSESVFGHKGSNIFPTGISLELLLAILCSKATKYFLKQFINHGVDLTETPLSKIILVTKESDLSKRLIALVKDIIVKQKHEQYYDYENNEQLEIDEFLSIVV